MSQKHAVKQMLSGFRAGNVRQKELRRAEGPQPQQAVREAISAADALAAEGKWPAPRDPVNEHAVEGVRRRWVRICHNARQAREAEPCVGGASAVPRAELSALAEAPEILTGSDELVARA